MPSEWEDGAPCYYSSMPPGPNTPPWNPFTQTYNPTDLASAQRDPIGNPTFGDAPSNIPGTIVGFDTFFTVDLGNGVVVPLSGFT